MFSELGERPEKQMTLIFGDILSLRMLRIRSIKPQDEYYEPAPLLVLGNTTVYGSAEIYGPVVVGGGFYGLSTREIRTEVLIGDVKKSKQNTFLATILGPLYVNGELNINAPILVHSLVVEGKLESNAPIYLISPILMVKGEYNINDKIYVVTSDLYNRLAKLYQPHTIGLSTTSITKILHELSRLIFEDISSLNIDDELHPVIDKIMINKWNVISNLWRIMPGPYLNQLLELTKLLSYMLK